MKRMLIALHLLSSATAVFADNFNNISIQGQLTSSVPINNVSVHILSAGAVVGTASEICLLPDATDFIFSTQTYITNPWVFRTGSDYTMRLSTSITISTFPITAVPFALTVRGDAQTGNQNIFGAYGNVGIGTGAPLYRLEISSAAGSSDDIVVVSTGGSPVIKMTGAGVIRANKYYGDGSSLTGITATGDNLGNHTATQNLNMAKFNITNVSTATFTGYINVTSTAGYQQGGATILTSPGYSDLFLGYQAGYPSVLSSNYNTMLGFLAGNRDTNGIDNSFIGSQAGYSNTGGSYNSFVGYAAGYSNTSGNSNSAVGYTAGYGNTTGTRNSFYGYGAGENNVDANDNTYLGYFAGQINNASNNTYVGSYSGYNGWNASNNSFLGYQAGYSTNGGNNNIYIGYKAGYSNTSVSNSIILGYNQTSSGSSTLNIGGVLYGNLLSRTIGIGMGTQDAALDVISTGTASNVYAQIWRASDATIKSSMSATGVLMASKFIGDGSGLTGVTAGGAVQKTGDTMTGPLILAGSSLTVTGSLAGGYAAQVSNLSNTSTANGLLISNVYNTNATYVLRAKTNSTTPLTTGEDVFFVQGDGAVTVGSSLTVRGNTFSVGGSTLVVTDGNVGIGNTSPSARLDVSGSISASGDIVSSGTFRGDGAGLTNLPAAAGVGLLTSTQTWSGTNTFNSSVTFNGAMYGNGVINDSTATFLTFGNYGGSGSNSTWSNINQSNLTMTTDNVPVQISFTGCILALANSEKLWVQAYVDSNDLSSIDPGAGNSQVGAQSNTGSSVVYFPANFTYTTTARLSAGSHTFSLRIRGIATGDSGLHCRIDADRGAGYGKFMVKESR